MSNRQRVAGAAPKLTPRGQPLQLRSVVGEVWGASGQCMHAHASELIGICACTSLAGRPEGLHAHSPLPGAPRCLFFVLERVLKQ